MPVVHSGADDKERPDNWNVRISERLTPFSTASRRALQRSLPPYCKAIHFASAINCIHLIRFRRVRHAEAKIDVQGIKQPRLQTETGPY